MNALTGKRVLLTGAAGGIGRASANVLMKAGAEVFLIDHDAQALARLADDLAATFGRRCGHALCDVGIAAEVSRAHAAARACMGGVDAAVLNAGVSCPCATFGTIEATDFERVMRVNVQGVLHGLNDLLPSMMRQREGAILIIGSSASLRGSPGYGAYVASKHAVIGLMRCAALEAAPFGVRVLAVAPGPTDTEMIESIDGDRGNGDAVAARRAAEAAIPLRRYGKPEEIAHLIAFLVSDHASYCNGAIYQADGGLMA